MSMIEDDLLGVLADLSSLGMGESLSYRVGTSGPWTALPGFYLQRDPPSIPDYDQEHQRESTTFTGMVHGLPAPVITLDVQIKGADGSVWAVESLMNDVDQIFRVRRIQAGDAQPSRGGV
jgi:hypothetical protein